jgi:thymidylate synthase (FAD)
MPRIVVDTAEAILDQEIKVLDKGFVRLVDYMGGDQRIVQSARVSYGEGTKSFRQDRGLIHYLLRNWHTSPFEQVQLTFHTKMPIFVARQWVRHRTARLNEISGRYSVMKDEFYLPEPEHVCFQSESNKQGRAECLPFDQAMEVIRLMEQEQKAVYANYQAMLDQGVARELARSNLPLSLYTEWYWQIDLHGRSICTICSTSCACAWTPTRNTRSASSGRRWRPAPRPSLPSRTRRSRSTS